MRFRCFLFLLRSFIFYFLYYLSLNESESLDDDYDDHGLNSGSSGTYSFCAFSLRFYNSVGSVSVLGSGVFSPIGVEYKWGIFTFYIFVPIGVESKGGRLVEMFWRSNSLFSFQIIDSVL